jgi:predicted dehydrogenase
VSSAPGLLFHFILQLVAVQPPIYLERVIQTTGEELMTKEIKWGIIGFGQISRDQVAPAFNETPNAKLVGIYDYSIDVGKQAASIYDCKYYTTLDELLSDHEIDAVYIATPNAFHCEHTLAAAKQKKHILCEKPMALNTLQCEAMINACHDNGVKLGIGYMGRFNSYNIKVKQLIMQKKIGTLKSIRGYFSFINENRQAWRFNPAVSGGGPIMDLGIHLINLLHFLQPNRIAEIIGVATKRDQQIELTAAALLKLNDDIICELDCSYELPLMQGFEIYGSDGSIIVTSSLFQGPGGAITVLNANGSEQLSVIEKNPYVLELTEMMMAIRGEKEHSISGNDGIDDIRIAEAWFKSITTGQRIKFSY